MDDAQKIIVMHMQNKIADATVLSKEFIVLIVITYSSQKSECFVLQLSLSKEDEYYLFLQCVDYL